jgi:hypothetical protein
VSRAVALVIVALALGCRERQMFGGRAASPEEVRAADALRADYAALDGAARLRRFEDGVTVTGAVAAIEDHGEDGLAVWLAVSAGRLALRFADQAADLPLRVTVGAPLIARCRIGGMVDDTLFLRACRSIGSSPQQP